MNDLAMEEAYQRFKIAEDRWQFWCKIHILHKRAGRVGMADEAKLRYQSFRKQMNRFKEWIDAQVRF